MLRWQTLCSIVPLLAFLPLIALGARVASCALLTLRPLRSFRAFNSWFSLRARFALRASISFLASRALRADISGVPLFTLNPLRALRASVSGVAFCAVSTGRPLDALQSALTLRAFGTNLQPEYTGIVLRGCARGRVLHALPDLSIQRHAVKHDIRFRAAVFALKDRAHPAKRHARHTSPPVRHFH